ncbi:MAG TPA: hypothetical protein VFF16_01315 [Telluria sp.]|nr:hypothetical protein [Telluria sp.]
MSATSHYFCVAHQPVAWPLPDFLTVIGTGAYVPERGIAMSRSFPELAMQNRHLGEYVALFAIRRMLLESDAEGFVGFCHYRRFALTEPIGQLRGFNYHAHPDLLARVRPEHFVHDGKTPIIPAMVHFEGNLMRQYEVGGPVRDLLHFFGSAVDCGVIDDKEVTPFLTQNAFITAPTVSYIPVPWFLDIVRSLEMVMAHYYRYHYVERDGYIARAMAFCCERLQALLLARKAAEWGHDKLISRHLTLLVDNGPRA